MGLHSQIQRPTFLPKNAVLMLALTLVPTSTPEGFKGRLKIHPSDAIRAGEDPTMGVALMGPAVEWTATAAI